MKVYRGVDGKIRTFRPDLNMQRMNSSAVGSGLPTFDGMELIKCLCRLVQVDQEWVPHGEGSSLYIRPTLIGIDVSTSFFNSVKFCYVKHFIWKHFIFYQIILPLYKK